MRKLGLYISVAFKAPVLVTMCMSVENRNPIGMLVLIEKRYGGKSLLDMIIRWQKYIVASPKGDIGYWLDENRLTELQILVQRDYVHYNQLFPQNAYFSLLHQSTIRQKE
eukprot:g24862.t1